MADTLGAITIRASEVMGQHTLGVRVSGLALTLWRVRVGLLVVRLGVWIAGFSGLLVEDR